MTRYQASKTLSSGEQRWEGGPGSLDSCYFLSKGYKSSWNILKLFFAFLLRKASFNHSYNVLTALNRLMHAACRVTVPSYPGKIPCLRACSGYEEYHSKLYSLD